MEGVIFDIKRFALHDGPGIRTTVFFKGCPLKCWWCHNPEGIDPKPAIIHKEVSLGDKRVAVKQNLGKMYSVASLIAELEKDRVFMDESGGGVTLSGGEPLMQHEFVLQLLPHLKQRNFHVALDTCGYVSKEVMEKTVPFADLYLFDLKHPDPVSHKKYTGADLSVVLDNLHTLASKNCAVRIRIPFIPQINGSSEMAQQYLALLKAYASAVRAIDILPYHKIAANKYVRFEMENKMNDFLEPSQEQTDAFAAVFLNAGFDVTVGG